MTALLSRGQDVEAVRLVRCRTGSSLLLAVRAIDALPLSTRLGTVRRDGRV